MKDQLLANASELSLDDAFDAVDAWNHAGSAALYCFLKASREALLAGDTDKVDGLIKVRELRIKGARAKIGRTKGVPEAWRGGRRLSYRFEAPIR